MLGNFKKIRFVINNEFEVIPLYAGKVKVKYSKEAEQVFFRKKLSEKLVFRKGCCSGYEAQASDLNITDGYLYLMNRFKNGACATTYLDVQEWCGGKWVTIFEGLFTAYNCDFDLDQCTITVEVQTNDEYACFLSMWDLKHNVYVEGVQQHEVSAPLQISQFKILLVDITPETQQPNSVLEVDYPDIATYGWVMSKGYFVGTQWKHVHLYAKEISSHQIGPLWVEDGQFYSRPYDANTTPRILAFAPNWNMPSYNPDGTWTTFLNVNQNNDYIQINSAGTITYSNLTIRGAVKIMDALSYLASVQECNITSVSSRFLSSLSNYVTGETPNPMRDLYINQKSNVVNFSAANPATIFQISMKELLSYLQFFFNVFFVIEGGVLKIEHISDLSAVMGEDLTQMPNVLKGKSKYSYNKSELPNREEWEIEDQKGNYIQYNINCANEGVSAKKNLSLVYTYLPNLMGNPEEGKDGTVFMMGQGNNTWNGNTYLFIRNLLEKFHKHNRPFRHGTIHGVTPLQILAGPFDAITVKKIKEQAEITYPACCNDFRPERRIKTQFGLGEVKDAEYDLKQGTITVNLTHDE